ncbi:flavodoxin family protein [Oscillibacter ruminantium]|uniref:flavodoxin family protein n=1 Tax=Oscillibacter ruminantium TaxID=1263547 RepID=UPI003334A3B1
MMKPLIVYYSFEGNTRYAALLLADALNADLLELEPVKDYPRGKASKYVFGGAAASLSAAPELKPYVFEAERYDLVILGSPVWAGRTAPPLNSFLKAHDLHQSRVAAFACSTSGNAARLLSRLEEKVGHLEATASFLDPASHQEDAKKEAARFAAELLHG